MAQRFTPVLMWSPAGLCKWRAQIIAGGI
jgi:hypothetical protein